MRKCVIRFRIYRGQFDLNFVTFLMKASEIQCDIMHWFDYVSSSISLDILNSLSLILFFKLTI